MKLHQFGLFPVNFSGVLSLRLAKHLAHEVSSLELQFVLERLLSQWEHVNREIKLLEKRLVEQGRSDELDVVYRTVPGVGALSARILSNELGDMSHFPNERALFSYTGLTPCEDSSGEKVRRGKISRQGNSYLRHVLVEVAWRAIRKDKKLQSDFERIANRRGKKRAIVAIARKLIGRIRAVFRAKGSYELEHRRAA
jgi:transposase